MADALQQYAEQAWCLLQQVETHCPGDGSKILTWTWQSDVRRAVVNHGQLSNPPHSQGTVAESPVAIAITATDRDPLPTYRDFATSAHMVEETLARFPGSHAMTAQQVDGALRVADAVAAMFLQAHGLPIATVHGLLAMPAAVVAAVIGRACAEDRLVESLARVVSPQQVRM